MTVLSKEFLDDDATEIAARRPDDSGTFSSAGKGQQALGDAKQATKDAVNRAAAAANKKL
jgi:hypothetical protein